MRKFTIRSSMLAIVMATALVAPWVYAAPFTWTISGTANSGQWSGTDLTGRNYVLRVTTPDSTAVGHLNPSSNFGYWNSPLSASVDVQGLGSLNLGFIQMQQFTGVSAHDGLFGIGAGSSQWQLEIPLGTIGNPTVLSEWGPVNAVAGGIGLYNPIFDPNAPFKLFDGATATSLITVCTSPQCAQVGPVPEPSMGLFLLLALAAMVYGIRKAEPSYSL